MESTADRHDAMFAAMISGYATQAMVALGKIANPMTGQLERNLDQARMMIDMLEMIEVKTKGNVREEESNALRQALSNLRLNYVDEAGKPSGGGAGGESGENAAP
jgi:hypothetical protein